MKAYDNDNSHCQPLDIGYVRKSLDKKGLQLYRKGQQHSLAITLDPLEIR